MLMRITRASLPGRLLAGCGESKNQSKALFDLQRVVLSDREDLLTKSKLTEQQDLFVRNGRFSRLVKTVDETLRSCGPMRSVTSQPGCLWPRLVAVAVLLCVCCSVGIAQPPTVSVQRKFVPADKPEVWPPGDWVPIQPDRLDELLRRRRTVQQAADAVPFERGTYSAIFNPLTFQFEQGRAELTRRDIATADGLVPLEPFNLALSDAYWGDGSAATIGTNSFGTQFVIAQAAVRDLLLDWSLAGPKRLNGVAVPIILVQSPHKNTPDTCRRYPIFNSTAMERRLMFDRSGSMRPLTILPTAKYVTKAA